MLSIPGYHPSKISYQLYMIKRNRQPDHLLHMIQRSRKQKQNFEYPRIQSPFNELDNKVKQSIRKNMIQKRVNNILNVSSTKFNVSEPVKFVKKVWVSPIQEEVNRKKFTQEELIEANKRVEERRYLNNSNINTIDIHNHNQTNRQGINKILKILNINKKVKYFGCYLKSQFDHNSDNQMNNNYNQLKRIHLNSMSILNIPKTKQSKLQYLNSRFKAILKKQSPKLFILNGPSHQQKYFYNPLQTDEYFNTIIKKDDKQLVRILIKTLQMQGNFSLTSFTTFYDIFVWQIAPKLEIIKFVTKILMQQQEQLQIGKIALKIDKICQKINLSDLLNQNNGNNVHNASGIVDNFSEIMKKLLFGEDYQYAIKNEYYMTRKILMESLEKNQECISIFVNVFYM